MPSKNHYHTLAISTSATTEEIKKAFRKLALQYHPDKHSPGNPLAAAKFSEIHEAYRILSDNRKRREYNYQLYTENPLQASRQPAVTPEEVLQLSMQLAREAMAADPYRIDRDLLSFKIRDLLSDRHLHLLTEAGNREINRKIMDQLLRAAQLLPLGMLATILSKLEQLTVNDPEAESSLQQWVRQMKQEDYWNRYKVYIALVITALACLLILLSKNG